MTTPTTAPTPGLVSPLQQSRVGRDTQRYDGERRLLACTVIVRPASDTGPDGAAGREVLLISSSKHPDAWILPKGGWEDDETLEQCALREAEEEAGVAGQITRALGEPLDFRTAKGSVCRLFCFELACVRQYDQWAEPDRRREWVTLAEARERLAYRPELVAMLDRIEDREGSSGASTERR